MDTSWHTAALKMEDVCKEIPLVLDDAIPFIGSFFPIEHPALRGPLSKEEKQRDMKLLEFMCDPSKRDFAVRWHDSCRCTQNGGLTPQLRISKMHSQVAKHLRRLK